MNSEYRMPHSPAVQQRLQILRNAKGVDVIEGRGRLAAAQDHLLDLLEFLAERQGYRLFPGERQKCWCENLADGSPGRILHSV